MICKRCGGFIESVDADHMSCDTCGRRVIYGQIDDSECEEYE